MSLSSSSTYADVEAAYKDNCSYDLNDSVDECKLFIQACRFFLLMANTVSWKGDNRVELDPKIVQAELKKAEEWRNANDPNAVSTVFNGEIRHFDVSGFRD